MAAKKKTPVKKAAKSKTGNGKKGQVQRNKKSGSEKKPETKKRSSSSVSANDGRAKKSKAKKPAAKSVSKTQNITASITRRYKGKDGIVRLRNSEGKFVDKETQEAIYKVARELDKRKIPFTYDDLLEVPQIADRMLVFRDEEPKETFYWNALALIDEDSKNVIVGDKTRKYVITSPDGKVTETNSQKKATELALKYNKILQNAEGLADEDADENPYLTIGVTFTENINSEILQVEMDFSSVGGRIPTEKISEYLTRANNGEKPKKNKAAARGKKGAKGKGQKKSDSSSSKNSAGRKGAGNKGGKQPPKNKTKAR